MKSRIPNNATQLVIAIDGLSSCGKSTLAKSLAQHLDYTYVDSGAMYRAVTLYMIRNRLDLDSLVNNLEHISIDFYRRNGSLRTRLNREDVEDEIRRLEVSEHVSQVSTIEAVRTKMVALQRQMSENTGVVMDGRDIGTVVFPLADIKLFVTADLDVRAQRRFKELKNRGIDCTLDKVKKNLQKRDKLDSTRSISPLLRADDAIELDTTYLTREEQLKEAVEIVDNHLK